LICEHVSYLQKFPVDALKIGLPSTVSAAECLA
jgi:hypothetical protein